MIHTPAALALIGLAVLAAGCAAVSSDQRGAPVSAEREIVSLHSFFEAWFRGDLPPTDEAFGRFSSAVDPAFELITPEGVVYNRDGILEAVRSAHGRERDSDAPLGLSVREVRVSAEEDGLLVVAYEEWHERAGEARGRFSTAVLRRDAAAPNGLRWIRVQETWMPGEAG